MLPAGFTASLVIQPDGVCFGWVDNRSRRVQLARMGPGCLLQPLEFARRHAVWPGLIAPLRRVMSGFGKHQVHPIHLLAVSIQAEVTACTGAGHPDVQMDSAGCVLASPALDRRAATGSFAQFNVKHNFEPWCPASAGPPVSGPYRLGPRSAVHAVQASVAAGLAAVPLCQA